MVAGWVKHADGTIPVGLGLAQLVLAIVSLGLGVVVVRRHRTAAARRDEAVIDLRDPSPASVSTSR